MSGIMSVKEASIRWNISERRVAYLCSQGRIDGARKNGRMWMIPADAEKPSDNRMKPGISPEKIRPSGLPASGGDF